MAMGMKSMTTREAYSKEEYERLERDIVGHSTISPSEASVLRAALRIASLRDEIVEVLGKIKNVPSVRHTSGHLNECAWCTGSASIAAALLSKLTGSEHDGEKP